MNLKKLNKCKTKPQSLCSITKAFLCAHAILTELILSVKINMHNKGGILCHIVQSAVHNLKELEQTVRHATLTLLEMLAKMRLKILAMK